MALRKGPVFRSPPRNTPRVGRRLSVSPHTEPPLPGLTVRVAQDSDAIFRDDFERVKDERLVKICDEIDGMKREQHIWDGPEEAAISRKLRARNVRPQAAAIARATLNPRAASPSVPVFLCSRAWTNLRPESLSLPEGHDIV